MKKSADALLSGSVLSTLWILISLFSGISRRRSEVGINYSVTRRGAVIVVKGRICVVTGGGRGAGAGKVSFVSLIGMFYFYCLFF